MDTSDNIIQLIFDKMFNQLTNNCQNLKLIPFADIVSQTFDNNFIYQTIAHVTSKPINEITNCLRNTSFQKKYLFSKLKNRMSVCILLDLPIENIKTVSDENVKLAVINDRIHMLKYFVETLGFQINHKLGSELISLAVEFASDQMYFYLKELDIDPTILTYNKAVQNSTVAVVKDINTIIGLSKKTIALAFETADTEIVLFICKEAIENKLEIASNLISYPIMQGNLELVERISQLIPIKWDPQLYHSALLSGFVLMVQYVEMKIPNVHDGFILDTARTSKGQKSLIIDELLYEKNNKKYFSHTMTYAIQSKSLEVVIYIYNLGYQITLSNIINAIQYGTVPILEFVLTQYRPKRLPGHLIHYFNFDSYVVDKLAKMKVLISNGFDIMPETKMFIADYKLEAAHLKMILQTTHIVDDTYDLDYLLDYQCLFVSKPGFNLNRKLITKLRMCIELGLDTTFDKLVSVTNNYHDQDKQFITDITSLFGTINQITKVYQKYLKTPSIHILMELLLYAHTDKLNFLIQNNIISCSQMQQLYNLSLIIANQSVIDFFINADSDKKLRTDLSFIIESGNVPAIISYIKQNSPLLDVCTIKQIFLLNDINLIHELNLLELDLVQTHKSELLKMLEENDLEEIYLLVSKTCTI